MFRWSKVVQFSVWPFDFPDFVGRALQKNENRGTVQNYSRIGTVVCTYNAVQIIFTF